jgi:hypothetical protein
MQILCQLTGFKPISRSGHQVAYFAPTYVRLERIATLSATNSRHKIGAKTK